MKSADFWARLVPAAEPITPLARPLGDLVTDVRTSLETRGYFTLEGVFARPFCDRIEREISAITRFGLPALFGFAYETPWSAFGALQTLVEGVLGADYRALAAFWAWRLDPALEQAGWPTHRDRMVPAIDESGALRSVTLWIAITDATLDNGCIRVVPANADATYRGDLSVREFREEDVRPLPMASGGLLGWSQNLIHWGGRASKTARGPRISLSAEFQRASDAEPFEPIIETRLPRLEERLALIGQQLLKYQHMQKPSAALSALAESLART
jgi:hypothetical protein